MSPQNASANDEIPASEGRSDNSQKTNEPQTGETTERQPSWRPGEEPLGENIYTEPVDTDSGPSNNARGRTI